MKVLVACEFSGRVRDAFIERGHDAVSCDLLPTESPGPHIEGDVRAVLRQKWDMVIAHPPCTYLCIMSQCRIYEPGRIDAIKPAVEFFLDCLNANAKYVAVENPKMHRWAREELGEDPHFCIQPWEFGHEKKKLTCFWTRNLPPLMPTQIMQKRESWVANLSTKERKKDRSRTFEGVAAAMAEQWGAIDG